MQRRRRLCVGPLRGRSCAACATAADCAPGFGCAAGSCVFLGDGGCTANTRAIGGEACPPRTHCDAASGGCVPDGPPVYPTCGQFDPTSGFDAGWGPGPSAGGGCAACIGCPRGTECVCGGSGLLGAACGPGNTNAAAALACFFTGAVGDCQIFPGDCATNSQCQSSPGQPYCSPNAACAQCLRDDQCPQDAGAQGCFQGACGPCCTANAQCPPDGPLCIQGFCYAQCAVDADCAALDAGPFCCGPLCRAEACDAGVPDAGDGGPADAGDAG